MKDVISEYRNTESMNCRKDEVQKLMIYLLRSKRFEYNRKITAIGQTFSLGNAEKSNVLFIYIECLTSLRGKCLTLLNLFDITLCNNLYRDKMGNNDIS